jgi:GTP-binding protein HflX
LHVRDIAGHNSAAEAADVQEVLRQIGLDDHMDRVLEIWNKADQLASEDRGVTQTRAVRAGAVVVSALTGEGMDDLRLRLTQCVDTSEALDLTLSSGDGEALAWLYRHGRVLSREDGEGDMTLTVKLDAMARGRFERLFPQALFIPEAPKATTQFRGV